MLRLFNAIETAKGVVYRDDNHVFDGIQVSVRFDESKS